MKRENGFIKQIVILIILALLIIFGFFASKAFWENKSNVLDKGVKGFIDQTIDDTKQSVEDAKNQAIQDAKESAADALKNKVDEVMGTGN